MPTPQFKFEIRGDDKSDSAFKSILNNVESVKGALQTIGTGAGIGFALKLQADTAAAADDLADFADQLGITTEALSAYQFIGNRAGISSETTGAAIERMSRSIAQAAKDTGAARDSFRELGLDINRLKDLSPDQQFEVIAEALSRVTEKADRSRLSISFFGREGVKLNRIVQDGAQGLRDMRAEAEQLGVTLSQQAADTFGKEADALDGLQGTLTAAARTISVEFAPAITLLANGLAKIIPKAALLATSTIRQLQVDMTGVAGAIANRLGFHAAGKNLADLSKVYQTELDKMTADLLNFDAAAKGTGVDVDKYIGKPTKTLADAAKDAAAALKLQNEEIQAAKGFYDSTRTAQEAYIATVEKINALRDKKRLDPDTAARAELDALIKLTEAEDELYAPEREAAKKKAADLVALQAKYYDQTRTAAERMAIEQEKLEKLYTAGSLGFEVYARAGLDAEIAAEEAINKIGDSTDAATRKTQELLKDIKSELDGFADDVTDTFFGVHKTVLDLFSSLAEDIAKAFFKAQVAKPLTDWFSSLIGPGLSLLTGGSASAAGFGNTSAFDVSTLFKPRAKGGPTFDRPTLVGEQGPEIIDGAGNVRPAGGGAVNITFNVNSLDPRTAAAVIVANRDAIVGVVRGAFGRQGQAVKLS